MRYFKKIASKSRFCSFCLIILLFSTSNTVAQDKVVVIPLFEDQQTNGLPAPVPKTGQTTSYATGDDGHLQKGVVWPNPRFTDNGDGTVTDNMTGLIWLKNALCTGAKNWNDVMTFANSLYDGWTGDGSGGDCSLSDGSSAGDWRLPNVKELWSLTYFGATSPVVPNTDGTGHWTEGDPFNGVWTSFYWSSTTNPEVSGYAWGVRMSGGQVESNSWGGLGYVWPVRGGN